MSNKKRINVSFDLSDPDQMRAYRYYQGWGHKMSSFLTLVACMAESCYGSIEPDMGKGMLRAIMVNGLRGTGSGVAMQAQTPIVPMANISGASEKKPRKTKPKGTSNTTVDIKKPEPMPDKTETPTKAEDRFEDEGADMKPETEPVANQGTEDDDDDYMIAPGMGIWDPVKLKESQKGMTMADIFK